MSRADALVGVDIGTTNVKAVAYDVEGRVLASAGRPQEVHRPRPGWAEYDPETMFEAAAASLREVVGQLDDRHVAGVAVASMAETAVALGADDEPVHAAIAWHDERTERQAAWWRDELGGDAVYAHTGLPILPIFGVNKMMWLREHAAGAWERTRLWLNTADYVAWRLSGEAATDLSLASRTMLLDLEARDWSDELLRRAGVDRSLLAPLVESGTPIGKVHARAQARTGLPAGTPVIAGGHDHPCGALALGVAAKGDVLDSIGTSESLVTVMDAPDLGAEMARSGYQQGAHVVPGRFYCNGGLYTAGAALQWIRELLDVGGDDAFARLLANGRRRGAFFLPHLRIASPPVVDPMTRAAFVGLDASTTQADLARAVVDGLVFEAQASLDGMEARLGFETTRLSAIGGGARIDPLMRAKASLLGREVRIADVDEATTLGAAMLAGAGAGVFASVEEASRSLAPTWRIVGPDPAEATWLREAYERVYAKLYAQLAPLHHEIHDLIARATREE